MVQDENCWGVKGDVLESDYLYPTEVDSEGKLKNGQNDPANHLERGLQPGRIPVRHDHKVRLTLQTNKIDGQCERLTRHVISADYADYTD
jgi:hypothetical protein